MPLTEDGYTLEAQIPGESKKENIVFICAMCKFSTINEGNFLNHGHIGSSQNNPLWCENCERCFHGPAMLISHIKERNCAREVNTYYCGTQGCVFQCTSICLFYKHLRVSHKHNLFIFCHRCKKKFTVPQSLILHMQIDCLLRNKNGDAGSVQQTQTLAVPVVASTSMATAPISGQRGVVQKLFAINNDMNRLTAVYHNVVQMPAACSAISNIPPQQSNSIKQVPSTNHHAKVASLTPILTSILKTSCSSAQKSSLGETVPKILHCPCCSFSAQSQLVLDNHYLVEHSGKKRNSCSVCHVTFETINLFFSHFAVHAKDEDQDPKSPSSHFSDSSDDSDDPSWCPKQTSHSQLSNQSTRRSRRVSQTKRSSLEGGSAVKANPSSIEESTSKIPHIKSHHEDSIEKSDLLKSNDASSERHYETQTVAVPLTGKNVISSSEHLNEIPHEDVSRKKCGTTQSQNANGVSTDDNSTKIHKIKLFEDLKSPLDIVKMQSELKLKHFFKCTVYNCTYTTDDDKFYVDHFEECHKSDKICCSYCLQQFVESQTLVEHMLQAHSKRVYQCSLCFYRACSKLHVQRHIKTNHDAETVEIYFCSLNLLSKYLIREEEEENVTDTTYFYVCTIGTCHFKSLSSKEFVEHNRVSHQFVSQLVCFHCQGLFFSPKQLVNHYRMHGMDNFQCVYCVHGSATLKDIYLHQCINHADKVFNVYNRNTQRIVSPKVHSKAPSRKKLMEAEASVDQIRQPDLSPSITAVQQDEVSDTNLSVFQRNHTEYPKEIPCLDKNILCRIISCEIRFKSFSFYLKHLKEEHFAVNILCPYCPMVCEDSVHFESHMMCHGPNLYKCCIEDCQLYSFKKGDVEQHMYTSHQLRSAVKVIRENLGYELNLFEITEKVFPKLKTKTCFYICPFCYYESTEFKFMKNHIYAEFIYKRFQCTLCQKKIRSRKDALAHFSSLHLYEDVECKIKSNPEIEFLTKIFLTPDVQNKFMEYLQSNHMERGDILSLESEYKCEGCCLHFKDISEWQFHWATCISKGKRLYTCNYCNQKFSNIKHIERHTIEVHLHLTLSYTLTENLLPKQTLLSKLQLGKLQFLKTMLIPYLKSKNLCDKELNSFQLDSKYYRCSTCGHDNIFRCNIQKHIFNSHKDGFSVVGKVKSRVDIPEKFSTQKEDETNDSLIQPPTARETERKPYACSFCDMEIQKFEELKEHVANTHATVATDSYTFFYFPDPEQEFSEKDIELYQCAYCSVSQENLFHLKRHHSNLHFGVPFQVCGRWYRNLPEIQCDHCDLKVASDILLKKHCSLNHPNMSSKPPKSENKERKGKIGSSMTLVKPSLKKKSTPKIIHCPCCMFSTKLESSLKKHYTTLHCDNNLCRKCHIELKTMELFFEHYHLHKHNSKKRRWVRKSIPIFPEEDDSSTEGIGPTKEKIPDLLYKNVEGVVDQNLVPREPITYVPDDPESNFTREILSETIVPNGSSIVQNNSQLSHRKISPKSFQEKNLKRKGKRSESLCKVLKTNFPNHKEQFIELGQTEELAQPDESNTSILNSSSSITSSSPVEDPGFSYYGSKPEPIDLYNITYRCGEPPNDVRMPVVQLLEQSLWSPLVYVKDYYR